VTTPPEVLAAAKAWYAAGVAVIPPVHSGKKAPLVDWKHYQSERPTPRQMADWYQNSTKMGVGILCGAVSGNLEMLETESCVQADADFICRIESAMSEAGLDGVWESLFDGYHEFTPSGGLHLIYRITDHPAPGNTKIAQRPKDPADWTDRDCELVTKYPATVIMETLIETRGEGGYVVVAPSQGPVHPSGNPWTIGFGCEPGRVPEITWEQREALVAVLSKFDVPRPRRERPRESAPIAAKVSAGTEKKVGDDFNERGDWAQILEPHGWTYHSDAYPGIYWERPGGSSTGGHSASTGRAADQDRMYVWSSATPLPTHEPMSKFFVYTELNHHGDWRASTKDLAAQGYGEQRTAPPRPPSFGSLEIPASMTKSVAFDYEPDQPVTDVLAAYDAGAKGTTAPPPRYYPQTSVGNAERMVDRYAGDFRYIAGRGGTGYWMAWDGKRWSEDYGVSRVNAANAAMTYGIKAEADAMFAANPEGDDLKKAGNLHKWFLSSQMDRGMKGTLSQFATRLEVKGRPEDFDQATGYLNLPNGIYNLDTHELLPHDRQAMFTEMFGTHYDPAATAPKFREFMETVVPDPQMRGFLQRAIGYSLTGRPNQRALMVLWGLKRTGKSQFTELMQGLFGTYGYTAMAGTFHKVEKRGDSATPGQHSLRGKRFVSISETSEDAVLDEDAIKRFTGTDSVSTRALYQGDQNWKPQCVIWIVTNNKPRLSSDDNATWDRVKLAHFPTQFSARGTDSTLKEIPEYAQLLFAEEAPGILNWALEGLREFQTAGGLDEPEQVQVAVEAHRRDLDPVAQFWDQQVEESKLTEVPGEECDVKALWKAYETWCGENRVGALGQRRFNQRIRNLIGVAELHKSNGRQMVPGWRWTGLTWVSSGLWPPSQ
jgi:P4 family phage/plasmid primase-like protien